jgi:hypothetical protein
VFCGCALWCARGGRELNEERWRWYGMGLSEVEGKIGA